MIILITSFYLSRCQQAQADSQPEHTAQCQGAGYRRCHGDHGRYGSLCAQDGCGAGNAHNGSSSHKPTDR